MKKFISSIMILLMISLILVMSIAMPVMAAASVADDAVKSTLVTDLLYNLINSEAAISGIIIILIAIVGYVMKLNTYTRHVLNLGILAYEYAESEGLAQKLKGYEKFDPFMDKFIKEYKAKYGKDPTPVDKGIAVQAMESQVLKEDTTKK